MAEASNSACSLSDPLVEPSLPLPKPSFRRLESRRTNTLSDPTVWGAVANLSLTAIGTIVLNLPSTFADTGWALGTILLILFGVLTDLSLVFLVKSSAAVHEKDFEAVGRALLGHYGGHVVKFALLTLLFGALITTLIIISDMGKRDLLFLGAHKHDWYVQSWLVTLVPMGLSLPLAFATELHSLRYTSLGAFGVLLCILGAVLYTCLTGAELNYVPPTSEDLGTDLPAIGRRLASAASALLLGAPNWARGALPAFSFSSTSVLALPSYALAFCCQFNIIPLYYGLPVQSRPHINFVIHASILGIALPLYILFACVPYFYIGEHVPSDFLTAWRSNTMMAVCQGLLGIVSIFKLPLLMLPLRDVMCEAVFGNGKGWDTQSTMIRIVVIGVIYGGCYAVSLLLGNLSRAVGIIGCTSGMLVCFLLPSLFYLRMAALRRARHPIPFSAQESEEEEDEEETGGEQPSLGRRTISQALEAEYGEDAIRRDSIENGEWTWSQSRGEIANHVTTSPDDQVESPRSPAMKWWPLFSSKSYNSPARNYFLSASAIAMFVIGLTVGITGLVESLIHWNSET